MTFISEEGVDAIIREREDHRLALIGRKCRNCGFISFPAIRTCVQCGSTDTEEVELADKGTLYTFTRTMRPVNHMPAGTITGYIDLADGARVFSPIDTKDGEMPEIGSPVKLAFRPLWTEEDGTEIMGYVFRPEEEVQA